MSTRPDLDTVLRDLDPADAPTSTLSERALADLDAILASTPAAGATTQAHAATDTPSVTRLDARRRSRRARPTWRTALAAAAAAGLLTVGVGLPVATQPAYAGWEAAPEHVDAPDTEAAAQECRDFWSPSLTEPEPGFAHVEDLTATLTEQRGPFTMTVMRGPDGQFADCLLESRWLWSGGGGAGSASPVPPTADPAADQLDVASAGAVGPSVRTILGLELPRTHQLRNYAYGRAGDDVTAVTLRSPNQGEVQATVQDGLWAAWWPSPEDEPEIEGITATVTLADGSTREVELDDVQIPWPGMG